MPDQDGGVNIPLESTADTSGFDAIAAAGVQLGARLKELQDAEAKASTPVAPPVSAPGAPEAEAALKKVGDAGEEAGKRTAAALSETDKFIHTLQEGAGGLAGAFKAGIGIGAAESVISALESAKEKLREVLAEGVEVNKEFETLGIGLASSLRQADPEQFGDFNRALEASGALIDTIKQKSLELNLDAAELGHNVQVNMLSLVEGGIHDLNAQVETTGLLMQAAAAKGITGFQAVRDVIDILNGKAERVILSKELGITNGDIAQAKAAGDLADYLAGKLGAYREAAASTRETLAGLEQTESNLGKGLEGQLSAGLFADAKEQARGMVQALNSPEVHEAAEIFSGILGDVGGIKVAAGDVLRIVALLASGAAAVADPISVLTTDLNRATGESDKLGRSIVSGTKALQDQVQQADTLQKQAAARAAVEDALATAQAKAASARRAGNEGDAGLLEQQAILLQRMLDTFGQTASKVVEIGTHEESRKKALQDQQAILDDQLSTIDKVDKALASRVTKDLKELSPAELQSRINAQLLNAQDLLRQGGVEIPVDYKLSDPEEITRLRDQINPALENYNALRAKLSEVALDVSNLGQAYDASGKKADEAAKKEDAAGQKQIEAYRKVLDGEAEQRESRAELQKITDYLASAEGKQLAASKDGQGAVNKLKADAAKLTDDISAAEKRLEDQRNKAFPEEIAQLQTLKTQLAGLETTGTAETADQRAALQNQIKALQDRISSKNRSGGPGDLDELDRKSTEAATGPGYGDDEADAAAREAAEPSPPSDRDAAGNRINDAADSTTTAATDTGEAADSLATAAGSSAQSAGTLEQQAGALQTAFGIVKDAQSNYHDAILDGLSAQADNFNSLLGALQVQNQTIANQASAIQQLQLQVGNLADTGDGD